MKKKILLSKRVPENCLEPYADRYDFTMPPDTTPFSYEYILEVLPQYDGYLDMDLVADKPVIDAAVDNGIKAIANYGAGYDKIDWQYATERGLPILNTPTSVTEATAELAATLIFSVMRGIARYDNEIRNGKWISPLFSDLNTMIEGSTLGIVGFGRIGRSVCKKAQGMGMDVVYFNSSRVAPEVERDLKVRFLPFDELLSVSDCVSLHTPYTSENHHLFNMDTFRKMKPTAYFVNTARGKLVDEAALCRALEDGIIKGAGLDVFEDEPNHVYPGLLKLDNVIMTPHVGSLTMRSRLAMCEEALSGLITVLEGGIPDNVVNPSVFQIQPK